MKNKHGFSLVELIVVLAIMAVLVGVLAPAFLRYVEKTRVAKDNTAAGEIQHAAEIVVLSGIYTVEQEVLVTFSKNGIIVVESSAADDLRKCLQEDFGDDLSSIIPSSNTYRDKIYKIIIEPVGEVDKDSIVTGHWEDFD